MNMRAIFAVENAMYIFHRSLSGNGDEVVHNAVDDSVVFLYQTHVDFGGDDALML